MARETKEIFNDMVTAKENDATLGTALTSQSKTAIWRLLFYIVAQAINTLEQLFDLHKEEVDSMIESETPGRAKWYAQKTLDFMKDTALPEDSDVYDTSDMEEDEISNAKVVKHAVAVESDTQSLLTIKVAGEDANGRCPIDTDAETQLKAYLAAIKYAGVRISLVNKNADTFNCEVDIYYNPQKSPETVKTACLSAVKNYIENLPFNGVYTNMALIDNLQAIDGVSVAELKSASSSEDGVTTTSTIDAIREPSAGYFKTGTVTLNMKAYE